MCIRDPNSGARRQAELEDRNKKFALAGKAIDYYNKETTWDKNRNFITGTGLSRDYSDIDSYINVARGEQLSASEDLTRQFFASQPVDEGGRSSKFGKMSLYKYYAKQSELDKKLNKIYTVGQSTALTGLERKTANLLAINKQKLGQVPTFGPATMMPGKDRGGMALQALGLGLTAASIAMPFMAPTFAATAKGTAVATGLGTFGSTAYSSGSTPSY